METKVRAEANVAIPPGMLLKDELAARGMSQHQLAAAMGRPVNTINAIIAGRKAITARTAVELERALDISARTWLHLESTYRLALERGYPAVGPKDYFEALEDVEVPGS